MSVLLYHKLPPTTQSMILKTVYTQKTSCPILPLKANGLVQKFEDTKIQLYSPFLPLTGSCTILYIYTSWFRSH